MTMLTRTTRILAAAMVLYAIGMAAILPRVLAADSGIGTAYGPVHGHGHGGYGRHGTCPVRAEDDPGWDWTRCGNLRRGIVLRGGGSLRSRKRVVGACVFTALRRQHEIDWRLTPHLHGDGRAARACEATVAWLNGERAA